MDKTELKKQMRKLNFAEEFRLYAHAVKEKELYSPFEDLVTTGIATVTIKFGRGGLIIEKAISGMDYEKKIAGLKQTVTEQTETIKTFETKKTPRMRKHKVRQVTP